MGLSVGEATHSASHWISLASLSSVVSVSYCFCVWGPLFCLCVFKTVKASNREHSHSIYVCTVFFPFVLQEPPLCQLSTSCCIQVCHAMAHLSAWLHLCVYVCVGMGDRIFIDIWDCTSMGWHAQLFPYSVSDSILHWSWTSVHAMRLFIYLLIFTSCST